jgi:hypothetical protein
MFLIFGIKRLNRRLATMLAICGQCTTPAAQVITRRSTWFSLFFIPVIPLGSKYVSTCTLCGVSVKLDKDQALQMVAAAQQVSAQVPGPHIPQPESMTPPPSASPLEP